MAEQDVPRYEELSEFVRSKFSRQDFETWGVAGYHNVFCQDSYVAWRELENLTGGHYRVEIEPSEGPAYVLHIFPLGGREDG
ncbi:MAG: hypothetical protein J2P58_02540 [Acidimicrobiaceae bacterium]|nr:hypothetical protein [Acidimicrobiaceae bacterium]